MRCKMKGSTNRFCIRLDSTWTTHASSIIEIHFLGGNSGYNTWFKVQCPYSAERISSGAI
jgi:hypothetical protein